MPLNLGVGEILVVLLVALVVLGPEKLPGAARNVGRAMTEIRRMSTGFQAELRDALQEPVDGTPRQAARLRHDGADGTTDPSATGSSATGSSATGSSAAPSPPPGDERPAAGG